VWGENEIKGAQKLKSALVEGGRKGDAWKSTGKKLSEGRKKKAVVKESKRRQ